MLKGWRINVDYPVNWNWYLQDEGSVQLCNIADFHDMIMFYCTIVVVFVTCILIQVIWWSLDREIEEKKGWPGVTGLQDVIKELKVISKGMTGTQGVPKGLVFSESYNRGGYMVEIAWIIGPSIILLLIGIPSIYLLYSMEVWWDGDLTIKIIGRQWFWTYEVCVNDWHIQFDSYTLGLEDIKRFRLLEVDNPLWVPVRVPIRLLVTSLDVILSFGVPSLGLKIDAIPNRLTYGGVYILRESEYIGYCSELCGTGLSNMNIVIKGVSTPEFKYWLLSLLD